MLSRLVTRKTGMITARSQQSAVFMARHAQKGFLRDSGTPGWTGSALTTFWLNRQRFVMNEDDLIPPNKIREWCKDPDHVEAVSEQEFEQPLDVGGLLVGIRFLHNFVRTPEGRLAVKRALDEGFVQLVPRGSEEDKLCVIPRLVWRDHVYDDLCPGKARDVSIGIQIARYMLWAPDFLSPDFLANRKCGNAYKWDQAIREALRRFEAERKQRRQRLAKTIRRAARKLAVRSEPSYSHGDGMVAISGVEIFELVRLRIPDVTPAEVNETIMQTLPYMGGPLH
jgi:hypothetical protein